MLAAQMAAVHNATMTFARRLAHVETIPQDSAQTALQQARAHLCGAGRGRSSDTEAAASKR
jgi:hypothetical protein